MDTSFHCGFHGKQWARQDKQARALLVGIILKILDIGALPSCLAAGLRVIGQVDSGPKYEKPIKAVVGGCRLWTGCFVFEKHTSGSKGTQHSICLSRTTVFKYTCGQM